MDITDYHAKYYAYELTRRAPSDSLEKLTASLSGQSSKSVTIPIHREMFGYIKNRVENNLPEAYVFTNANSGLHYSKAKLGRIWDQARGKAGLDKSIRLYDATRHSFATQLINANVPLFSVSRLLGHADTRTTEKYSHGDIEKLKIDISNLSLEEKITKLEKKENVDKP